MRNPDPEWATIAEAAAELHITPGHARELVRFRELPAVRWGKKIIMVRRDVLARVKFKRGVR